MNAPALVDDLSPVELRRLREMCENAARGASGVEFTAGDRVDLVERLFGPDLAHRLGIYRIPEQFKLSVVMPVYNEVATLERVIERVAATGLQIELVIVDDGSRDGSRELLTKIRDRGQDSFADLKVIFHERNQGKGAALKTGFLACTGNVVIIQDADLEYDPQDYRSL